MISLKRYMNRHESESVLREAVSSLLETMGSSAAVADEEKYKSLRAELDQIRERAGSETEPEGLLSTVGSARQTLETYNRGITRFLRAQGKEMQGVMGMITDTVAKVGGATTYSAQRFREIGEDLEKASSAEDLAAMKKRLGECLVSFKEETLRQRAEAESLIATLRRELELSRARASLNVWEIDPATQLPEHDACLKAMYSAMADGRNTYVVTMVDSRLQSINARFGDQVGDRMLFVFGKFVQQHLGPDDQLFRWNGPAVVALVERAEPLDEVRRQITTMLDARIDETFEMEARSVLISPAWSVFPLVPAVPTVEKQINTFVASQGSGR